MWVSKLLCATTHGGSGGVAFIADDEASAQAVLEAAGIVHQKVPSRSAGSVREAGDK
jgi:hypothetical protein